MLGAKKTTTSIFTARTNEVGEKAVHIVYTAESLTTARPGILLVFTCTTFVLGRCRCSDLFRQFVDRAIRD